MAVLKVRLLGGFELERADSIVSPPATPKSRSLLAYMILRRDRLTHRETLCATLWPDESEAVARKALRTALWRIRSALDGEMEHSPYIYADAYQAGLRRSAPVSVDIWDFDDIISGIDAKVDAALDATDAEAMACAASLYRGPYAAGVYDDWISSEQSRLHQAYLRLLERMAAFHALQQRWLQAIGWAERALASDPLREHLHRTVMACHISMGDRPSALRQYARCEAVLRSELGIQPMAETRALLDQIRGPAADSAPAARRTRSSGLLTRRGRRDEGLDGELCAAVSTLRQVARKLDKARSDRGRRSAPIAPILPR